MIQALKKEEKLKIFTKDELPKNEDIIVERTKIEITYDKDGKEIRERKTQKINLTKKINESKKLLNNYTAEQKIAELEKIFSK